jgi:serine/threonine protein kinase
LIKNNGEEFVYKIEKCKDCNILNSWNTFTIQIDFNEKVAKHHPGKFMTLISYGIINDCNHIQKIEKWRASKDKHTIADKNKNKICYFLIYKPVLKHTFYELKHKISADDDLYFKYLYQILDQINIMKKAGYQHGDLHDKNIMSDGEKMYIIDYGSMDHRKYNDKEKNIAKGCVSKDLIKVLWSTLINPIYLHIMKNKLKLMDYALFIKELEKIPEVINLKKNIPKNILCESEYKDVLTLLVAVSRYDIYKKTLGYGDKKYVQYNLKISQKKRNFIIFCINHLNDKDYSKILNYLTQVLNITNI